MGQSKYRNQPQRIDGYYFPSTLEANVYRVLSRFDKNLKVHKKIVIVKAKEETLRFDLPTGGFMAGNVWKDIVWTPDFYSPKLGLYVEAKGVLTDEFKLKMKVIAFHKLTVLSSTIFVGEIPVKWQGVKIISFDEFKNFLKEQKQ